MKLVTMTAAASLVLTFAGSAQTGFGFCSNPIPFFQLVAGATVPGDTIESIHHVKLGNNADGEFTTALTLGSLEAMWGGDGLSKGVHIIRYNPSDFTITSTNEADALNSTSDDIHLALSTDGLHAIFERKTSLVTSQVYLACRAAVGDPFPAPTPVAGFPVSGLSSGEYHPYLGTVGGINKVFYTRGADLVMQDINLCLISPGLTGSPVVVANPAQVGVLAGSPSPMIGADGDVEALWACDIVIEQAVGGGGGDGDADPVLHNDLMVGTPGMVRVQRSDWQGWGSIAGGLVSFSHDILGFHAMHGEGAILIGDSETPGGRVDIRTQMMNRLANPVLGFVLLSDLPGTPTAVPGWCGSFALAGPISSIVLQTSTTSKDGIGDTSFLVPNDPLFSGVSVAIQALMVDLASGTYAWTNTAWVHVL